MADESSEKADSGSNESAAKNEGPGAGGADAPEATAPSPADPKADEPSARALRFAHVTIGVAIFLCLTQIVFAVGLHRPNLFIWGPLVIAALLGSTYKLLRPARRLTIATMLLPAMLLIYGFEGKIARGRPYDGSAAARRGIEYDNRSVWEAILDSRAEGKDAYPSFQPRALLVLNLAKGLSPDELQNHIVSPEWGVSLDGERVLPLGGVANKHIIYCNEGGKYAEYESDEHGFNNPKGMWQKEQLDVALIGDSFTQAACVGQEENAAHWIRQKYPATLNLGMAGNGPMIELAGLEEHIAPRKPKIVFWVYYNNDMADLDVEKRVPMLNRYLEEDGFTQKLEGRQDKIDAALIELSGKIQVLAPKWPGALSAVGLTRKRSPMWLADLAMNESHSAATAVMRLDRLTWGLTSLVVTDIFAIEPDYPLFRKVLDKAKRRVEGWGGKLYFVYMADMYYLQYKGKREHNNRAGVLKTVAEAGIPLIDTQPRFFAEEDQFRVRFHTESHCNPAGYKLAADILLEQLQKDGK